MAKQKRPRIVESLTVQVNTGCGKAYVTPTYIDGKLFECFMHLGKAGGCAIAQGEALLRCISIGIRYGVPVEEFTEQLRGIRCPSVAWEGGHAVLSCPDAIAKVLSEFQTRPTSLEVTAVANKTEEELAKDQMEQQAREREEQGLNG